jgi:hypothetical protein
VVLKYALPVLVALSIASPALAQQGAVRSKTTGFMLGLGLNGTSITSDESGADPEDTDKGSGGTVQIGYGFNRRLTGFLDLSGVVLDGDNGEGEVTLAQAFAGVRVHLSGPTSRLVPFFDLGAGVRGLKQDDAAIDDADCAPSGPCTNDVGFSGGAFMFGGGLSFYASRTFALTGALNWAVGEFSHVQIDNVTVSGLEVDATTARLNLGITWFPGR